MKNKFFLWLSLLITLSVISHSCRNEDLLKSEANPQRNDSDFFKHKSNVYSKTGIDYVSILKTYNREKDFLSTMPDKEGMPIWEKMYIIDSENATGLLIPLSKDNETLSSILFATLNEKNLVTGIKDYDNQLLKNIVYNSSIDRDFRERIFFTFMHMDNYTFGNQYFTAIPNDLFKGLKYNNEYGRLKIKSFEPHTNATESGRMIYEENCGPVWSCKNHETFSQCDNCNNCYIWSCGWTMVWVDNDFPPSSNIPGEGGGGGGTPGSGGTPPKDPCALTGINQPFYRMQTGCNGSGNTDLPGFDDPCQKTNDMLARPNVQQGIANVKANADLTLTNPKTGEIGFKEKKDGTVVPADITAAHQVVYNDVTDGYGGYHNHTATGVHMVSPPDIVDTLFGFASAQSINDGVGNAYYGMIAAESCSSCPGSIKYVHYVIRFAGTGSELGNFVYSPTQMMQFIKDYRKTATDLVDPYINGTTYSNSLGDLNEKGLEKLFFDTLQNMGLTGKVVLQRIENSGIVYNVTQDSTGTITATPCP